MADKIDTINESLIFQVLVFLAFLTCTAIVKIQSNDLAPFKTIFIYLLIRNQGHREGERERHLHSLVHSLAWLQRPKTGPSQSHELAASSRDLTWEAMGPHTWVISAAFPRPSAGSWLRSKTARAPTSTLIECWHHKQQLLITMPQCYPLMSFHFLKIQKKNLIS